MTRGRWEGSGTFETASTPGPGFVLAAVAVIAALGAVEWLVARIWWLIAGSVLLIAAALAVLRLLIRAQERREARWGARRQDLLASRPAAGLPRPQRAEVTGHGDTHLHIHLTAPDSRQEDRTELKEREPWHYQSLPPSSASPRWRRPPPSARPAPR